MYPYALVSPCGLTSARRRVSVRAPRAIKLGASGRAVLGGGAPLQRRDIMGRFDSRNTNKMRQRKAQSKKKARIARRAEETRAARQGKS